jgi:hypothetical protein
MSGLDKGCSSGSGKGKGVPPSTETCANDQRPPSRWVKYTRVPSVATPLPSSMWPVCVSCTTCTRLAGRTEVASQ